MSKDLKYVKKAGRGISWFFQGIGLVVVLFIGMAFAQNSLDKVVPHAEAGKQVWDYLGLMVGSGIVISFLFALHQVAQGLAYGFLVRGWNVLAPHQTAVRFGTANGCYDADVTKVGLYAAWSEYYDEKNDCLVIDRVPYGMMFNGRLTTTTAKGSKRKKK